MSIEDRGWSFPHGTDMQAATSHVHSGLTSDEDVITKKTKKHPKTENTKEAEDLGFDKDRFFM